jgi:hypothetical protein
MYVILCVGYVNDNKVYFLIFSIRINLNNGWIFKRGGCAEFGSVTCYSLVREYQLLF